jgi:hypothetical protein
MPNSSLSLDPLSSPSPSPSPEHLPEPKRLDPSSAGLETDSELSELTEEEQEVDRANGLSKASVRSSNARGRRITRRGRGRKRSTLVPAPMWGWAEAKANSLEEDEDEDGPSRLVSQSKELLMHGN